MDDDGVENDPAKIPEEDPTFGLIYNMLGDAYNIMATDFRNVRGILMNDRENIKMHIQDTMV
jgi:hypothetical protein